ncbi:MAG: DUF1080 domain-containing protein [Verrucomicrobiae bacterium]|nr:DUF1080 domain-containing protein [Verrucomicrobiae bacterium]
MRNHLAPLPTIRIVACALALPAGALAGEGFEGAWALTIPGGAAGCLEIMKDGGGHSGRILWGGGSVLPLASVSVDGDKLTVTRVREVKKKDASGAMKTEKVTDTITAKANGDDLSLVLESPGPKGAIQKSEFSGKRQPPMPKRPDLSKVKFGEPIQLFNGKDLSGWRLVADAPNGWRAENGVLINRPAQEEGKPKKRYGNLRTDREFEDFRISTEVKVPEHGNSGIYLRGIYEVQVADWFDKPVDSHGMGAVYSRITPTANPCKKPGEWQSLEITLVDRHATVILNGQKIIDNEPVPGCTGGALSSDVTRPGPIYLQGDHEAVDFRNMVLRPVVR